MANQELVQEYSNSVKELKKQFKDAGISDEEFKKIYFESLKCEIIPRRTKNKVYIRLKIFFAVILTIIVLTTVIFWYKTLYSCIACSLQEYIYPGLWLLRKLSIPILSLFPSLTALYHETCLIQNPFFSVVDMDCWPCSVVTGIREIHDPKPVTEQQTPPFFYKTEQNTISIEALKKLYLSNKELFDREAPKMNVGTKPYKNIQPDKMFHQLKLGEKDSYVWKFNNMNIAKVLRQKIQRPKVVPKFGQSTERFIIVDTSQQAIRMPDTECSFSFLMSLSGSRTIHLVPAEECRHQCTVLNVDLQETYLLWYNWWYWRPVIQSSNGNETFIAHIGSYC